MALPFEWYLTHEFGPAFTDARALLLTPVGKVVAPHVRASAYPTAAPSIGISEHMDLVKRMPVRAVRLGGTAVSAVEGDIPHIVRLGTEPQMSRILTRRVVANDWRVEYVEARRHGRPGVDKVRNSMGKPGAAPKVNYAVAGCILAPRPRPAGTRPAASVNPTPEPRYLPLVECAKIRSAHGNTSCVPRPGGVHAPARSLRLDPTIIASVVS